MTMRRTKNIKTGTVFAGDFETTGDPNACRVYMWQIRDVKTLEVVCQGTKIAQYFEKAPGGLTYFHNMGFDSSFVYDQLLRIGFKWRSLDNSAKGRARGLHVLAPGEMTSLIGDMGQHYQVSWNWRGKVTTLNDSLKKTPGKLKDLAKAYGVPVEKGETPLHWNVPDDYEPTAEEWKYLDKDTYILAYVLQTVIGEGYTSMTIGADCFHDWKAGFHQKYKDKGGFSTKSATETFRKYFPVLSRLIDTTIRKAYRGGWTHVRGDVQGRLITGGGRVYDVNSMYPSVMVQELFPYGKPVKLEPGKTAPGYPLSITGAIVSYTIKPDHLPCIPNSAEDFGDSGWSYEGQEVELWGTEREWALWAEQYDLYIEKELGGYGFRAISGKEVFGDYIDHYMAIKMVTKGAKRSLAKLSLNNLWGKFGTNPLRGQKVPQLKDGDGPVVLRTTEKQYSDPIYTPVAIYTTAYARERIVRVAQANYDRFLMADTDSAHLSGSEPPVGAEVHPVNLGAWAHEGTWTEAIYCRSKAYVERLTPEYEDKNELIWDEMHGGYTIKVGMAGLPAEARVGLYPEMIHDGMKFSGKLARKRVVGGMVLSPVDWKLDYECGIVRTAAA